MGIADVWLKWADCDKFSGVFSVSGEQGVIFEKCCGYRNRSENLTNNSNTSFGIASGTKMFTGLAVCKLIEETKLSLEDKLCDVLPYDLGQIDKGISIFHLLTHTSGIGDYIDEETENSAEQMRDLYSRYPVYLWDRLEYYLPMITPLPPKFKPGERFGYSNAGFVLLGLVVEAVSGLSYHDFVRDMIITPCKLEHTDFYRMDALPANTALGYMNDKKSGEWRTNIYNIPIRGGSDGGLFTCAGDLDKLWRNIFSHNILSEDTLSAFLKPQVFRTEFKSYGLGIYRYNRGSNLAYYAAGSDFGVNFFTAYFPERRIVASALGNTEINTHPLLDCMLSMRDETFDAI
jgi:CubicO group peptidase (beta-lactamase class C family)